MLNLSSIRAHDYHNGEGDSPKGQRLPMETRASGSTAARILLVEDEASVAEPVALNLREEGYHVTIARRGDEGHRLATSEPYDLVILDLMLPGMDGRDVCRAIRRASDVPVL